MDQQRYFRAVHFISRLDKRYAINKRVGWVYALRNGAFKRSLLKIGMTTSSPHQRARELESATGVPGRFDLVYFVHTINCAMAEFQVHAKLADYRTSGEFFEVPISIVVSAMDEAARQYPIPMDLARPSKRGGWSDEILPQAFRKVIGPCPHCGTKNRIHTLAVPFRPKCGSCGRKLELNSDSR